MTHYIIQSHPIYLVDRAIAQAQATAAPIYLQCPYCEWWYQLRPDALALEIEGDTAIVRPGWAEDCPACHSDNWPGSKLVIHRPQKEDITAV